MSRKCSGIVSSRAVKYWLGWRRQRPSKLLWNCRLGQGFYWKHWVSFVCYKVETIYAIILLRSFFYNGSEATQSFSKRSYGRFFLGQGAKVFSESTQDIYPRHHGSWRCRAVGTARWSVRWWRRRSEWSCRSYQKQRSQHAWIMQMTMGWTETQTWATWATLCKYLNKENSQWTMTVTDNQEQRQKKRRIFNAWCLMHWHQLRSQISRVFQVTSPIVGLFALHFVSSIQLLLPYPFSPIFDLYANSM